MSKFDTLTTWIFDSGKCSGGKVKRAALMPELANGRLEVSAYGVDQMSSSDVWKLNERKDRAPKGRAVYAKQVVDDLPDIYFEPDPPPSQHGNVIGWPEGEEDRSLRMGIAKKWSEKAEFKCYPD